MIEEFLWTEKYRPRTLDECILPQQIMDTFQGYVKAGNIPNIIMTGNSGLGKTTTAMAMCAQIGADTMKINASLEGNVDTLRTKINSFCSTVSMFSETRKMVILDEVDASNPTSFQPALRGFMEEFSKNAGFILTANYKNKIIPAVANSRCAEINFTIPKEEKSGLMMAFFKRVCMILDMESVTYDKMAVRDVVTSYFPDCRKILMELQSASSRGDIVPGSIGNFSDEKFKELVGFLKGKKFNDMRKWVGQNADVETSIIMRTLYDRSVVLMDKNSIPMLVEHINETDYRSAFCADKELNLVAGLTRIMADVIWN